VSSQDPTGADSTESIRALGLDETLSRRLVLTNGRSVAGCTRVEPPDACVVFTGSKGVVASSLSAFTGKDAAALKARIAALVSPALRERLQALAPIFSSTLELDAYGPDFLGLVWPEGFAARASAPRRGTRSAGCAFDAAFGFPCRPAEEKREAARFGAR
jgi:hypothetical protein